MAYKVQTIVGMTDEAAAVLNRKGIKYAEQLLEVVRTPAERRTLVVETGVDDKAVLRWANHVDLMRIHGIGPQYAEFFEAAGVDTVRELAHRVPENLLAKLEEVNAAAEMTKRVPALKEVKRYVREAKNLDPKLEY